MTQHRILFIDAARAYAVILALGAHAILVFGLPEAGVLSENHMFFTTMATPMFIFMFGVMMELAYVRKASTTRMAHIDRRLWRRAYQCYMAFLLTAVSAFVAGKLGLIEFLAASLMLRPSYFGNILILYTVSLLIMPLIIRARVTYGVGGIVAIMLGITPFVVLMSFTAHYDLGGWGFVMDNLIGLGTEPNGPSVPLAMLFILAGMLAGHYAQQGLRFYKLVGCTVAGIVILVGAITGSVTPSDFKAVVSDFGYGTYRSDDSILYFLWGTLYSLIAFAVIRLLVQHIPLTHGLARLVAPLGKSSLLAFTLGNILLNLWHPVGQGALPPSIAIFGFFGIVWFVCRYTEYMPGYSLVHRLFNPSFSNDRRLEGVAMRRNR